MARAKPKIEDADIDASTVIAGLLQNEGFRAKLMPNGSILSGLSGLNISIVPTPPTIQLLCSIALDETTPFKIKHANQFNSTYRFGKVFIDSDDDVVLVSDFVFDHTSDDAGEDLKVLLQLFDGAIHLLRASLSEVEASLPEDDEVEL